MGAIQARLPRQEGALSLAESEAGRLALAEDGAGRVSLPPESDR
jgi:hypothetical protein